MLNLAHWFKFPDLHLSHRNLHKYPIFNPFSFFMHKNPCESLKISISPPLCSNLFHTISHYIRLQLSLPSPTLPVWLARFDDPKQNFPCGPKYPANISTTSFSNLCSLCSFLCTVSSSFSIFFYFHFFLVFICPPNTPFFLQSPFLWKIYLPTPMTVEMPISS